MSHDSHINPTTAHASMRSACEAPSSRPLRPRLLAIGDDADVHRLLKSTLRSERVEVHGAASGERGMSIAMALQPDVILLDMTMTDGDGFALLDRLKADAATLDIPVIFLARSNDKSLVVRGLDMGAIDFVVKPFDVDELKARVRSALRIRSLIRMLAQRAQIDGLTGLWNRAHFDQRLLDEIISAQRHDLPLSLVMCDLDDFKCVNDHYGHTMGDRVLEDCSRSLAGGRAGDIACRYGGEEFAIILPRTAKDDAAALAERMRESIAALTWDASPELRVTASFGVAEHQRSSTLPPASLAKSLIEHADAALYVAKNNGRNRVVIDDDPHSQLRASA